MLLTMFANVLLRFHHVLEKRLENIAMLQTVFANVLHPLIHVLGKLLENTVMLQTVYANVQHLFIHVLDKRQENIVINREIVGMANVNVHHLLKLVVGQHLFVAMVFALEVIFMI